MLGSTKVVLVHRPPALSQPSKHEPQVYQVCEVTLRIVLITNSTA
jgi:hypothetical protein